MRTAPPAMKIARKTGRRDPVEQDPVLVLPGHGEVAEDQREDEDVVDCQRLLDQVAGEVLAPGLGAVGPPHHATEAEAERDPDRRPDRRLLDGDDVRGAVGDAGRPPAWRG